MSSGAPLNLTLPASGTTNWGGTMNANLTAINSAVAALQAGGSVGPAGPTGAAGAVGMIYTGPWSSLVSYVPTDAVLFNGSTYIATAPNVGAEPDTHPTSWAILAAAGQPGATGATGAAGAQGPAGPAGTGGGSTVTFPITLLQGGTGVAATTTQQARTALLAAQSGANTDISSLDMTVPGGDYQMTINPQTVGVQVIAGPTVGQGIAMTPAAPGSTDIYKLGSGIQYLQMGTNPSLANTVIVRVTDGMIVEGAVPNCINGQIGFGAAIASSAGSPNGLYLVINNQGTLMKIALLAN